VSDDFALWESELRGVLTRDPFEPRYAPHRAVPRADDPDVCQGCGARRSDAVHGEDR
jgi:hypothetical protein